MKKRMILLSALLFLMTGCGQKVITVAGIQSEEEVQAEIDEYFKIVDRIDEERKKDVLP